MTRSRALLLLGVLLATVLGLLILRSGDPVEPIVQPSQAADAKDAQPVDVVEAPVIHAEAPAEPVARAAVSDAVPSATSLDPTTHLVVFGRTIDEHDLPLAGVAVRLQSHKVWTEGIDVARLPGKPDLRGWETLTDENGGFRFEVPRPTVDSTWLTIRPDPFHDSAEVYFGGSRNGARPQITLVDQDLGVFRLASTGAIRGSVTDESGRGLPDAELNIGNERNTTLGRNGTSDAGGSFIIAHVPPGSHGVKVKCAGYLSEFRKPIEVSAGQFTEQIDFVLRVAPRLSGVVVDDLEVPIEGVKLWGWPKSSGQGAGSKSLADGSFTISLPQDEPYTLEATRDGYEPYHVNDRSVHHAPGTSGLRIVMKRTATWPMHVIDSATDLPIERFGFSVLLNNSGTSPQLVFTGHSPPPLKPYPGGVAQVHMRPGVDVVIVAADSYQEQRVDLEPGPPPEGRIVVRMERGAAVVGRLLAESVPAAGVALRLQGGAWRSDGESTDIFVADRDAIRTTSTDGSGHFRFAGVDHGDYRVTASAPGGKVINVEPFSLRIAELDLGDLELVSGAAILGQVIVPPGRSRAGLKIHLDEWRSEQVQVTNVEGRFRFEGLFAGRHKLLLDEVPGAIGDPPAFELSLAAGEQREVVYDVSQSGTCQVGLTILLDSLPAVDADIQLAVPVTSGPKEGTWQNDAQGRRAEFYRLGKTDANGRVRGWVPARGTAHVVLLAAGGRHTLEHPSAELELTLDARIDQVVNFAVGTLLLELPDGVVLPQRGHISATLRQGPDRKQVQVLSGAIDPTTQVRAWSFEDVLAGEAELGFKLFDAASTMELVSDIGGVRFSSPKPVYEYTQSVVIRAGTRNEIRLR